MNSSIYRMLNEAQKFHDIASWCQMAHPVHTHLGISEAVALETYDCIQNSRLSIVDQIASSYASQVMPSLSAAAQVGLTCISQAEQATPLQDAIEKHWPTTSSNLENMVNRQLAEQELLPPSIEPQLYITQPQRTEGVFINYENYEFFMEAAAELNERRRQEIADLEIKHSKEPPANDPQY